MVLPNGGNLHFCNLSGCGGLFTDGAPVTISGNLTSRQPPLRGTPERWLLQSAPVRAEAPNHGGQVMGALTAVAFPAVTVAVATPGWQPGRLAVTV